MEDLSNVSDGYHTFAELYEFRMLYNALAFNCLYNADFGVEVYKSKKHFDGEECFGGGWFIVVAILKNGKQISNHYRNEYWDLFKIPSYEKSKYEFDGHTSQDVIERLREFLNG